MIIFTSKEISEAEIQFPDIGLRKWRWVVNLTWNKLDIESQVFFPSSKKWLLATSYFVIVLTKKFGIGYSDDYYDGHHYAIKLGWLHIYWGM